MRKLSVYILLIPSLFSVKVYSQNDAGQKERAYLIQTLTKMADPMFNALSEKKLKLQMTVERSPAMVTAKRNPTTTHLEGFARLLGGMAPWLELGPDETKEGKLRKKYIDLAVQCIVTVLILYHLITCLLIYRDNHW
jgi:hypothetical protein